MKEYKVVQIIRIEDSEALMNQLAQDGWRVISTAATGNRFIVTFERNI